MLGVFASCGVSIRGSPFFSEPLLHVFSGEYEALPSWQCYEDLVMGITKLELVIGTVPA